MRNFKVDISLNDVIVLIALLAFFSFGVLVGSRFKPDVTNKTEISNEYDIKNKKGTLEVPIDNNNQIKQEPKEKEEKESFWKRLFD